MIISKNPKQKEVKKKSTLKHSVSCIMFSYFFLFTMNYGHQTYEHFFCWLPYRVLNASKNEMRLNWLSRFGLFNSWNSCLRSLITLLYLLAMTHSAMSIITMLLCHRWPTQGMLKTHELWASLETWRGLK